ncbi:hypothetical protein [Mesorhizobium sp.]|uniref:hypothetical protein n=1 Tax=Mesorhizobium sp. TaxID=1871066 RepID=UPI00257DC848|nr:hypothetical protein [Mesorhizobium sp.]
MGSYEATAGADAARAGTERGEVNARTGKITALHTENQVDDGPAHEKFLSEALPLFGPTRKIGWLVTSRLEKYRNHTEAWLQKHDIKYDKLIMLELPSKAERQRLGVHGNFKADF